MMNVLSVRRKERFFLAKEFRENLTKQDGID
jgi:hypothetical protein